MRIFVMGAGGFIGTRVSDALEAAGHEVFRATRPAFDFVRDHHADAWRKHLRGFDVAINAVGIFRERGPQTFEALHERGPVAMFEACASLGIAVIQFSALGADGGAATEFHLSKKRADDALLAMDVSSVVLQPSLVHGEGGASASMFATLASLPVIPLPRRGQQRVQPVHVDDVAQAVVALVGTDRFNRQRVPLVGPRPMTLRELLAELRSALGLGRARFIEVPSPMVALAARSHLGLLDADALRMLERGNTADDSQITALLGHEPRAVRDFIAPATKQAARHEAQLGWLLPLLRVTIAIVWLTAGVVSAGVYPVAESLALLARTGLTGAPAYLALYGAVLLDLTLGVATLVLRRRRWLWLAQMALVLAYTAIITVALPEQWLHPYGPVVKNLPMLAAILALYTLEKR